MKKLRLVWLAGVLILLCAGTALAADVKASGYWWIEAVNRSNWTFLGKGAAAEQNEFIIEQKLRTAFTFTANENLRAILDTQIGAADWGEGLYQIGSGRAASATTNRGLGANAANSGNIMLRRGYVEYKWPGTAVNISVGYQIVTLPAAFGGGSAILDDQMAAAVVSAPLTDHLKLLAGYTRLVDTNTVNTAATAIGGGGNLDAMFAALPIDFKGVNVTPFAMYATGGKLSTAASLQGLSNNATSASGTGVSGVRAYWAGAAFTMTAIDPLKVMADVNYGSAKYNNDPKFANGGGREGYMFDLAVDYTGMSMMTPEAFFVYSSGEKHANSSDGKSTRIPLVGKPQNWTIGSFFFGERLELDGFIPTGGYTLNTIGYWAAGVSLKDIALFDKFSHTVNVLYARGTNSPDTLNNTSGLGSGKVYGGYLTTKDSLWEVDLNTRYKIYDELSAYLYLGYVNASFDKNLWGNSGVSNAADIRKFGTDNAYKIGLGLNYFF